MTDRPKDQHETSVFASVRAITAITREFDRVARDLNISVIQYRLMLYLKDGPRRAGEVAARNLVTNATISGHISALRKNGWVDVDSDEADRRVTRLVLSKKGRAAMLRYETMLLETLREMFGEEERAECIGMLEEIYWSLSATRESRYRDFETSDYKFVIPEIK